MVWFQFYQYIFIGTPHTQRLEKRGETRKAAEREANSRERKKEKKEEKKKTEEKARQGGREAREGTRRSLHAQDLYHLPRRRTTWEQSRAPGGLPGCGRKGAAPQSCGWGGNRQVPGPRSSPTSIFTPAPCPATYFWSMPAGRAPAGSAGRRPHPRAWWQRPLVRPALTSPRPCRHPSQAAARLQPTDRPAPPRRLLAIGCPALSSAGLRGWRRGRPARRRGGAPGEEPAGPLGNPAGSGDPERRKESPGPLRAEDSL